MTHELKLGSLLDETGQIVWKPINGYEREYLVSNNGDVYSLRKDKKLKAKTSHTGYKRVGLSANGKVKYYSIHRLVATMFIPNPNNKPTVNHKNENKLDNRVENLEWMTNKEQNMHGTRIERARLHTDYKARKINYDIVASKHNYQEISRKLQKPVVQKDASGNVIAIYNGVLKASNATGINAGKISECTKGKRKHAGGWTWEYAI